MRIAFDAICLGDGPVTGVARSFLNGLEAYAAQWSADMVILVPTGCATDELPAVQTVPAPRGAVRRQRQLPGILHELQASLLHSSVASVPLRSPCPTIATVHDLPWMHDQSDERSTWWRRFATTRALRAATAVIAPSQFTAQAAQRLIGSGAKVHCMPHTTKAPPVVPGGALRTGPFVVLGDDRARKNRDRVRTAHRLARERCPDLPELCFVGPPDHYVSEGRKAELLTTCRGVVQCSLYEGFGMPVLEALAFGAPLLCSDIPPHREIVEASSPSDAILVDPRDPNEIADGLVKLATHPPTPTPRPQEPPAWRALHESLR